MKAVRWGIELLASTWRYEIEGDETIGRLKRAGRPVVYAVWHGAMLPGLWRHRRRATTLLVSRHADGARVAMAAEAWGYRVVRGSTTRGAGPGLLGLVRTLQGGGDVAITPDGPRGPARLAKRGVVAAAQAGAATIVPVGVAASSQWRARSWDSFLVPRPFARVRMVYGDGFAVPQGAAALESGVAHLQADLDAVTARAECAA